MSFDLTRGEMLLVAFIFVLIYSAGFLPKLVKALAGKEESAKGD